jgi:type II secretory pathway component PulC
MHRRVLIAAFLAAIAFFVAHVVNLMIAHTLTRSGTFRQALDKTDNPLTPRVNRIRLTEEILASGIFAGPEAAVQKMSLGSKGDGPSGDPHALPSIGPPIDAAKKIKLVGTVVGEEEAVSLAVIEDINTKKQTLYHFHDLIPNVGQIARIRKDAILIQEGAQHEVLDLAYAISVRGPNTEMVTTPAPAALESQ